MTHRTRVKICGVTDPVNAREVCSLQPDMIGLNFWPDSSRFLKPSVRSAVAAALPDSVLRVGVFVDPSPEEVERAWKETGLNWIQVHKVGWRRPTYPAPLPVIPAFSIPDTALLDDPGMQSPSLFDHVFLIDAFHPTLPGGTGRTIDLERAAEFVRRGPCMIAGGLTPENVAEVVKSLQPYGVDTASGVENSPGLKNLDKVQEFILQVRTGDTSAP